MSTIKEGTRDRCAHCLQQIFWVTPLVMKEPAFVGGTSRPAYQVPNWYHTGEVEMPMPIPEFDPGGFRTHEEVIARNQEQIDKDNIATDDGKHYHEHCSPEINPGGGYLSWKTAAPEHYCNDATYRSKFCNARVVFDDIRMCGTHGQKIKDQEKERQRQEALDQAAKAGREMLQIAVDELKLTFGFDAEIEEKYGVGRGQHVTGRVIIDATQLLEVLRAATADSS